MTWKQLVLVSQALRVQRAAEKEGIQPGELEDAITVLASRYPVTADDVLTIIEQHGLEDARAKLAEAAADEP